MKNIYKLVLITLMIFLCGSAEKASAQTLIPPGNLQGTAVEDVIYLSWTKPDTAGVTPAGLLGYVIYQNGDSIAYVNNPDSLFYYDSSIDYPGIYTYTVTANYDMTSYGFPGTFQQSGPAGPVNVDIAWDAPYPIHEDWTSGTFAYNGWHFIPEQGNWNVDGSVGNQAPAAAFRGLPQQNNYDVMLYCWWLNGLNIYCGRMIMEFDFKLNDISAGSTEKLAAVYRTDGPWINLVDFTNNGTTNWTHVKITIPEAAGKWSEMGFRVTGENSSNISEWLIDNIDIYPEIDDPQNINYTYQGNIINLTWDYPCGTPENILGFNLYRTDETGNAPFYKLNAAIIVSLSYTDNVLVIPGTYRYIVTALFSDTEFPSLIVTESPGNDTITVNMPLGIGENERNSITILNSGNKIEVKSPEKILSCEIYDLAGVIHFTANNTGKSDLEIPATNLSSGIYILKITTVSGLTKAGKLVLR